MRYPKLLRLPLGRAAMIPAAFLCVTLWGCADQEPIAPDIAQVMPIGPITRTNNTAMNQFFIAWSQNHSSGSINTQTFALDRRQERQWGWYPDDNVKSFAKANPGRMYIVGDEPDQYCMAGADYAQLYHDFVEGVRAVDPTARFSPAGFAEPNYKCCPLPDDVPWSCWYEKHSNEFAQAFWTAHIRMYGVAPVVHEWRFHDFGLRFGLGDMNGWWERINTLAAWSVEHGAPMVLGAWGFHTWRESDAAYQEHIKQAMGRILADSRINGAVYWSYEQWAGEINYLQNPDGSLTAAGQAYANPMTDVPVSVSMSTVSTGRAQVRWANTTSAWGAEVEYWVKPLGSDTFSASYIQTVPSLGASQAAVEPFRIGDAVRARVRYANRLGAGAWSALSAPVVIARSETNKNTGSRNPRFCSLTAGSC